MWKNPKVNYTAGDEVVPEIFNDLGTNEQHLKEEQDKHSTRLKNVEDRATKVEERATS